MRWLITGAGGMLGRELVGHLRARNDPDTEVIGLDRIALDITAAGSVGAALSLYRPQVVVNCAAYTAVDDAETDEVEAQRINGTGAANLAVACAENRARLIHISTDYVFAGDARTPYPEDHPTAPRTAYGRTKLAGEEAVLKRLPRSGIVVRTAWLYAAHGHNFVRTMIDLAARGDTVDVVDDQYGQPTWAADVAERVIMLGERPDATGIFHATNSGVATWYELAREVLRLIGADPDRVRPTTTEAFGSRTPRPAYTVLGHDRWSAIGSGPLRHWRRALREALRDHPS